MFTEILNKTLNALNDLLTIYSIPTLISNTSLIIHIHCLKRYLYDCRNKCYIEK